MMDMKSCRMLSHIFMHRQLWPTLNHQVSSIEQYMFLLSLYFSMRSVETSWTFFYFSIFFNHIQKRCWPGSCTSWLYFHCLDRGETFLYFYLCSSCLFICKLLLVLVYSYESIVYLYLYEAFVNFHNSFLAGPKVALEEQQNENGGSGLGLPHHPSIHRKYHRLLLSVRRSPWWHLSVFVLVYFLSFSTCTCVLLCELSEKVTQVAFEGDKMTLMAGSRDRWLVLADSPTFANFDENILSFQVTLLLIQDWRLFSITLILYPYFLNYASLQALTDPQRKKVQEDPLMPCFTSLWPWSPQKISKSDHWRLLRKLHFFIFHIWCSKESQSVW